MRSRRQFLATAAGALAVALGTSACGAGGSSRSPDDAAGGGQDDFPVTVEHSLGSTVIERRPERVVTLGYTDADVALALGVTPVGIHTGYDFASGVGPWAEPKLPRRNPSPGRGVRSTTRASRKPGQT